MLKSIRGLLAFRTLFFVALFSFGVTSCAGQSEFQKPPVSLPVALDKTGVITEFQIEIKDHLIYAFSLRFKFLEENQTERAYLRKMLGGDETDKSGKVYEPGIPMPIVLTITKLDAIKHVQIYQKEVNPILTSWGNGFFDKNIGHCDITPGVYKVRLENLRALPEFSQTSVEFVFGMDKFKSSFDPKKSDKSRSCPH